MYHKYSTDCIVLGSREVGEHDRVYALYTEMFGLVWARAAGVRLEKSKMRTALTHYTYSQATLVRGKKGWRITGMQHRASLSGSLALRMAYARVCQLVLRLVAGDEVNRYLFHTLRAYHTHCTSSDTHRPEAELVVVARILYSLGYLSHEALGSAYFTHTSLEAESLGSVAQSREKFVSSINQALSQTQL